MPADPVDPDIRRFVDALNRGYAACEGFATLPLAERRAAAERIRAPWREGGPVMAATAEVDAAGVRLRLYRPTTDTPLPVLLYAHGGGWTMFSIDTHDRLVREYAAAAGVTVAAIDYSRSPEARFPVALDEMVAAVGWLRANGAAHGIDGARLAIGGDSAGANLAVATALRLREAGAAVPVALLLNYGVFGIDPTASYATFGGPEFMLTPDEMAGFWANYLGEADLRNDPYAVPLLADLHGLPPTFLVIAECDILADEDRAMAEALATAGVAVTAKTYPGATHSFLEAMSISPLARAAIADGAAFLTRQLRP